MSTKRHHADWLSLVEVSGPFLSMPVLEKVFPQGLDAHDADHSRLLRLAHDEWEDNQSGLKPTAALHGAWIKFVLQQTLGFTPEVLAEGQAIPQTVKATVKEHAETLRPDFLVRNPDAGANAGKPRLLIQTYSLGQNLEKPVWGRHWKASPSTRMMELLHSTEVRLGLVTNGEHWMLVDAPRGETTGFASWYAGLWLEEPVTLRAFRSLLGVRRFFGVGDDETLEAILAESASHQQEVTDQLGLQVRHAVEVLIQTLDRADQDHGRALLAGVPEAVLYESALTVMMRLVFLFCAEERGLLLLGDPLFDQHYAVSTLVAQLQEAADQHGEEVLERRLDAWVRLLSTFRAVYGGVQHERMKLPPYAGHLFNPDRFPFLEGRKPKSKWRDIPADPLPVDNRTVLHLLRSLQYLEMHGEARRLSFRALDIEQIGHVYEGLLDHTAKRATEAVLGLAGAKGREPEVPLSRLEEYRGKSEAALLEFLADETGRSVSALKKGLKAQFEGDEASLRPAACGNDRALLQRVRPFAGLVRDDTFGRPVVIRPGSVYVTAGTDRRSSGTHYTPKTLTEPIVQYTLEPLVYIGPAEGKPKEEWKLRPAKELLELKVSDMACGSGAFLVQACRYLAERLLEAWEDAEKHHAGASESHQPAGGPATGITPYGELSTGQPGETLIPREENERLFFALRQVAHRCLYGVDKNPLAVEMAKLSLWLLTVAKDKPFTFLDHAIRCGDSLVGIHQLRQMEVFHLQPEGVQPVWYTGPVTKLVKESLNLRSRLAAMSSDSVADVETQSGLLAEAQDKTARLRLAADLLLAVEFQTEADMDRESLHDHMALQAGHYVEQGAIEEFEAVARKALNFQKTFHWPLEFPEVFVERGGFDALVCNPPFVGGRRIRSTLGAIYLNWLTVHLCPNSSANADLSAFFFRRATSLLKPTGGVGMLATNTIGQGDTRSVGLDPIVNGGCSIYRAIPSRTWPGTANVFISAVWWSRAEWMGKHVLDDKAVSGITPSLAESRTVISKPWPLVANAGRCYQGSVILGTGFILEPEEAERLIQQDTNNRKVIKPVLNGQDLNSQPDQLPTRYIIDFHNWPLSRKSSPASYRGSVAEDFPSCLRIIEDRVRPERMAKAEDVAKAPWWQFWRIRKELYTAIASLDEVLTVAATSRTLAFAIVPSNIVFSHATYVFAIPPYSGLALLQSVFHETWARTFASSMKSDLRYTPTDCFENFPFPNEVARLDSVGTQYHQARKEVMLARKEGLTKIYNRFHNSDETAADIQKLRDLHVEMDNSVAATYGWAHLDLDHGFRQTKQGVRFTIGESAQQEVHCSLLKLNHDRYVEEGKQGLHSNRGNKRSSSRSHKAASTTPPSLFPGESQAEEAGPDQTSQQAEVAVTGDDEFAAGASATSESTGDRRPPSIEEIDTDSVMAAFRQASRGRGSVDRQELLKEVARLLGCEQFGSAVREALRGHLRAAIRRRIIEPDGDLVHPGHSTMDQYDLEEIREALYSVMRAGKNYEREEVIHAVARYLGFVRVRETVLTPIESAINSAIRQGVLGYEGNSVWRVRK